MIFCKLPPRPHALGAVAALAAASLLSAQPPPSTPPPNAEAPIQLEKLSVSAKQEALTNSIDRKVYAVGQQIQGATGSASDVLQNIPSVQVDIDGNVSLRGADSVLILIDGKPSTLMSARSRADALAQMPADSIERIEVITNPSAKYQPDGTAGIINIVSKRKSAPGFAASLRVSAGNDRRANAGLSANYRRGKLSLFANLNLRQDDRLRTTDENRRHPDAITGAPLVSVQHVTERMRPISRLGEVGGDFKPDANNRFGATASYHYRTFFRTSTTSNLSRAADGGLLEDYDRLRTDHEWQKTLGFGATYEHRFADAGHELKLELKRERHWEHEDNRYTNLHRTPALAPTADTTLIQPTERQTQLSADYTRPLADGAKLEAGYAGEANHDDADFRAATLDPVTGAAAPDVTRTNDFIYRGTIHALYATYARDLGPVGLLAGLRAEQTQVDTEQVTLRRTDRQDYSRLHPSLHLTYRVSETGQLQLNYSHRIRRPDSEDLNPFPQYQDPYNLRVGNPHLRPEETHSIETGYQYRREETTYLATLYYRATSEAFTSVTHYLDATTLLTTQENVATSRSGGLEFAATAPLGARTTLNASANAYLNEIDAANLGYSGTRSATGWEAKLNFDARLTKTDTLQLNSNYRARRLTPQGYRLPTFVANLGFRHDFRGKRTAFVFTVSDLFNSLRERTLIDTPLLHDEITRRRSSRIFYAGFSYSFGQPPKKAKDDTFKPDESL